MDVDFWLFYVIYLIVYSVKVPFRQDKYFFLFWCFWSFPRFRLFIYVFLLCFKMSAHQTNKDKPRSSKCRHFCFAFDAHNYCPTCRESGKGDDHCVTFENPCEICTSFTEEQLLKISQRKRYVKKQKRDTASSKDNELDLLGDDVDSFTGSHADLESAADNLFTSPPRPQPFPSVHYLPLKSRAGDYNLHHVCVRARGSRSFL